MITWKDITNLRIFKSLRFKAGADIKIERPDRSVQSVNMHAVGEVGKQGAPAAKTTSTTLTAAELLGKLITGNQGAAGAAAYQLPTGANLEAAWKVLKNGGLAVDDAFDFNVINLSAVAAEDITLTTNTGWTLVGSMVVIEQAAGNPAGSNGHFRVRRTAENTFVLYRIA